ncbi:Spo0B domain-containing protein [Haloimpatiens sp. FM7330]|uniref:Spo0B domain-containing protein n=1 Tax=Haloimpatiens sp. FM7330 TaxID=3298610 RepID=UPI003639F93E
MEDTNYSVKCLRKQRHDFMNDIQIIYGYLQTQNSDKAKEYIKSISKKNEIISSIYSLGDNFLGLCLEKNLKKLWSKEVEVSLDIEINELKESIFKEYFDKKCDLANNIFNELENNKCKFVYIYLYEDELGKNMFISNNEDMVDELNWMEQWEKISSDIDKLLFYKCYYDDNLAYRIIFSKN